MQQQDDKLMADLLVSLALILLISFLTQILIGVTLPMLLLYGIMGHPIVCSISNADPQINGVTYSITD